MRFSIVLMDFFDDLRARFFMIPHALAQDEILGTWCVTAQTGLDMDTVGETLNFEVVPIIHAPEFLTLTVLLISFILTIATTILLKRKSRQLPRRDPAFRKFMRTGFLAGLPEV